MSSKKRQQSVNNPLFKIDPETGKRILLPIKVANPNPPKEKEKKEKRIFNLAPFHLTAADFEDSPNRAKKMKMDSLNSVRKELFNLHLKPAHVSRLSSSTKQAISRSRNTKVPSKKLKFSPQLSPLFDMEEVEEEMIKKNGFLQAYPFKTPSKPVIKFTRSSENCSFMKATHLDNKSALNIQRSLKRSESLSSTDAEFLELEKICGGDNSNKENEYDRSPISSVCDLLEGTMINSSEKAKDKISKQKTYIIDLKNLIIKNNTALEEYKTSHDENISKIKDIIEKDKKQYETFLAVQEKNHIIINDILNKISPIGKRTDNESTPIHRRSMRLLNKSPLQSTGAKLIVSPVVLKSRDLRKSTLTKNLVTKTKDYNIESPRIQKALSLYNSLRCEISVLATPKLDRTDLSESPESTNLSRNLSRRVQKQCLLLQDTPIHKQH